MTPAHPHRTLLLVAFGLGLFVLALLAFPVREVAYMGTFEGRYLGRWRLADGEKQRCPEFTDGRDELRIDAVGQIDPYPRRLVVTWNGRSFDAHAGLSIPTAPGLVQVRPEEGGPSDDVASTAFCVTVSTLQWPAVFSMEDPDSDELYVNLRPELGSERSIESTAVRYVRVES